MKKENRFALLIVTDINLIPISKNLRNPVMTVNSLSVGLQNIYVKILKIIFETLEKTPSFNTFLSGTFSCWELHQSQSVWLCETPCSGHQNEICPRIQAIIESEILDYLNDVTDWIILSEIHLPRPMYSRADVIITKSNRFPEMNITKRS